MYDVRLVNMFNAAMKHATSNMSEQLLKMKKRSERRKHCALAVVRIAKKISPRRRPLPGGAGRPKFNQLETVATFT